MAESDIQVVDTNENIIPPPEKKKKNIKKRIIFVSIALDRKSTRLNSSH